MEINRMLLTFTAHPHGKQKHNCAPSHVHYRERRQARGIAATTLVALGIPPFCLFVCFCKISLAIEKDECSAFIKRQLNFKQLCISSSPAASAYVFPLGGNQNVSMRQISNWLESPHTHKLCRPVLPQ